MEKIYRSIVFFISVIFIVNGLSAQDTIEFKNEKSILNLSDMIMILEDKDNTFSVSDVASSEKFEKGKYKVANLGLTNSSFWIKFKIKNLTGQEHLLLELSEPTIDDVELHASQPGSLYNSTKISESQVFSARVYDDPNFIFDLHIPKNESRTFFLKVSSKQQIQLPLFLGTPVQIFNETKTRDFFSGLYWGIMIIMILYNLFVFISVKDKVYLYYVIYIIIILLTQASTQGYTFKWLWPDNPWMATHSLFLFPALVGMAFIEFTKVFLQMKQYVPKMWKGTFVVQGCYIIGITAALAGYYIFSYKFIEIIAGLISLYMLVAAAITLKYYRPARFYLVAWSIFLVGVIIFVLKDFEVLPYNNITRYTMQVGSAIESVLLSFALADRINILKKEKEDILEQQTETLKIKVAEATHELQDKNVELESAYKDLQEAQAELLQQEKMVSLGQMAAGVAHEINNPIHITNQAIDIIEASQSLYGEYIEKLEKTVSEAKDIDKELKELSAFKEEIEFDEITLDIKNAIKRAKNGIERTATITKELKNFSKIDSEGLVVTNINHDLDAMLDMLQSQIGAIKVKRSYGNIPPVKCHSQKLNQLYQNIFTNSIEAIKAKDMPESEGLIEIRTLVFDGHVVISFTDNGEGMSTEIKQKAFNPFFTTKGAQRKGLGLANAYRTLNEQDGKLEINSEEGKGTTIELILPVGSLKTLTT